MNNVTALPNVTIEPVETMTSSQLAELLQIEKKEVNRKIKDMFTAEIDGGEIPPSLDARGYVAEYHLNELHSTMFVGKWHTPFLRQLAQFWIDRKKPAAPTTTEAFAHLFNQAVITERQLAQQNQRLSAIESKVEKIQDLTEQLLPGYLPIKVAWREHCNLCSYDTFRDFVTATQMPTKPLVHVPDGTVVVVRTHQVKVTNVKMLANDIRWRSVQETKTLWSHPALNNRFRFRG